MILFISKMTTINTLDKPINETIVCQGKGSPGEPWKGLFQLRVFNIETEHWTFDEFWWMKYRENIYDKTWRIYE